MIDSLLVVILTTFATFVALVLWGSHADLILSADFVAVGLFVGLKVLYNAAAYIYGDAETDQAGARRRQGKLAREVPGELFEFEGRVSLGRVSEFDYESRLRPLLRGIAIQRLAANRHVDVQRQPQEARACLGERLWNEIERRPTPGDPRDVAGPTIAALRGLVDDLESI